MTHHLRLDCAFSISPNTDFRRQECSASNLCLVNKNRCLLGTNIGSQRLFSMAQSSSNTRAELTKEHPLSKKYCNRRTERIPNLPVHHYINLTNGIEAIGDLTELLSTAEIRFTRIQSSHCESGAYNKLLMYLDNNLLFSLACGHKVYVYDFASRNKARGVPRSVFLGIEFIKWSLAYLWFGKTNPELVPGVVMVRGKNTVPFWRDEIMSYKIEKDLKKRLRYFSSFALEMGVTTIDLHGIYGRSTVIDGCTEIHTKMVREWMETNVRSATLRSETIARNKYAVFDANSDEEELVKIQSSLNEPGGLW